MDALHNLGTLKGPHVDKPLEWIYRTRISRDANKQLDYECRESQPENAERRDRDKHDAFQCHDEDARQHLTRTSSAAATGSEAENLLKYFSDKNCERTAGSRRLQRFVRPLVSNVRGTSPRHFLLQYRPAEE